MTCLTQSDFHGAIHCFTARLADPDSDVLVTQIDLLRDCVRLAMTRSPFLIRAACVLPSELHMIWQMPSQEDDFLSRWRLIKSTFAKHVCEGSGHRPLRRSGDGSVWQRGLWDAPIRSTADLTLYELHCLTAPVRQGLVTRPEDWPHSSLTFRASNAAGALSSGSSASSGARPPLTEGAASMLAG